MKTPLFSLIIPAYISSPEKAEMLNRLLKSVPVRNDLEILVCNDASPEIIKITHPNTLLISVPKPNGSAGKARNVGLQHARGKWIFFADADDYFKSTLMNQMNYVASVGDKTDGIYFTMYGEHQDGTPGNRHLYSQQKVMDHINDPLGGHLLNHFIPTSKFIKKSYIDKHSLRFGETRVANDMMFSVNAVLAGGHMLGVDKPAYTLTQGHNSLSTQQDAHAHITRIIVKHQVNKAIESSKNKIWLKRKIPLLNAVLALIKEHPRKGISFTKNLISDRPYLGLKRAIKKTIRR